MYALPRQNLIHLRSSCWLQILTNGLYKSPEHRVILTSEERFSIAAFSCPPDEKLIGPIAELVSESKPIRYKSRTFAGYRTEVMTNPYMAKALTTDAWQLQYHSTNHPSSLVVAASFCVNIEPVTWSFDAEYIYVESACMYDAVRVVSGLSGFGRPVSFWSELQDSYRLLINNCYSSSSSNRYILLCILYSWKWTNFGILKIWKCFLEFHHLNVFA